jgi:methyltransferase-like protein 6
VFLEVGCGVGNTAFPLLALDDTAVVYCCDFSKRAVDLVRARRDALPTRAQRDRIVPFVCDITNEPLSLTVPAGSVDVCTMVFVLSAVSPEKMRDAVRNVSSVMRPGAEARVLIRDYASGDLAQERFAAKAGQKLAENFYVRGDGTRAFYFSPETLKALFAGAGMALERLDVHRRAITNRGQNVKMDRRWVQASFASARVPAEPLPPPPPPPEPEWAKRAREAEARRAEAAAHAEAEAADRREREAASWAEVTAAVETCARGDLERLVLGMVREGVVAPETLVRRLKEASDEGEGRRLQKET